MPDPTLEDVLSVRILDPTGTEHICVAGTLPWTLGPSANVSTFTVFSSPRLKELLEFDGSFTQKTPGEFTRTVLPKPTAGDSLKSVGWKAVITPPNDASFDVEPLILMEVVVELASVADSALGPFRPDVGDDRLELLRLSFSDARVLWNEFGHLAGRRNFEDPNAMMRAVVAKVSDTITLTAPAVKVDAKTGKVSRDNPKEVTFETATVSGGFAPDSLLDGDLASVKKLLDEVVPRLPLIKFWEDGGAFGPPSVAAALEKIYITDIDYKVGTPPGKALEIIGQKAGLVFGPTFDGRLVVEFDAAPSDEQFKKSKVFDHEDAWTSEERGSRVKPRAPLFRFYPRKVIKEVATTDFERVAKRTDGAIVEVDEAAAELGLAGNEQHLTYLSAVRAEVERPGERDDLENAVETPGTQTAQEAALRAENTRIVSDSVGRSFRYNPADSIAAIQQLAAQAREQAREKFTTRVEQSTELGEGGKPLEDAGFTFFGFNTIAMLDSLLSTPLNVVTRVGTVDLKPRFAGDLLLHRMYDFLMHANVIATNSFDFPKTLSTDPRIIDGGFNQDKFDERVNQTEFFGRYKPGTEPANPNESHARSTPGFKIPNNEQRTLRRTPADWPEAKSRAETFQSYFKRFLGFNNGKMRSVELNDIVSLITAPIVAKFGAPYALQTRTPPLEIMTTWVSGDATEKVDRFDPSTGVVEFSTTMGIFFGTISFHNFLRDLVIYLEAFAKNREEEALDPNRPYKGAGVTIPPLPDTQMAYAVAKHINIILSDDGTETRRALDTISATQSFVRQGMSGFLTGAGAGAFRALVDSFRARNSGKPLWQIASLKSAVEKETDPTAPPPGTVAPTRTPWTGNIQGPSTPGIRATITVAQPLPEPETGAGQTQATDIGQSVGADGQPGDVLPMIFPSPILGQFYVEAPFNEYAWPHIEIGADGPAKVEQLAVDWLEDLDGNPVGSSAAEFEAAARKRFEEINASSTIEESEEIEVGGIFEVELGSLVRSATLSWGEAGSAPRTYVSTSSLITRKLPSLRAIQALQNGVVKGRS